MGFSVSLSSDGSRVAIGAIDNNGNGSNSGHVRIYELQSNNSWSQLGQDIDGEATDDDSHISGWLHQPFLVSLSSDGTLVMQVKIGAPYANSDGRSGGDIQGKRILYL